MRIVQLTLIFKNDESKEIIRDWVDDIKANTECMTNAPEVTHVMCHDETEVLWEDNLMENRNDQN